MTQRNDADAQASSVVDQINSISTQIAGLNDSISKLVAVGQTPNDLMDTRDKLIDDLLGARQHVGLVLRQQRGHGLDRRA